MAEPRLKTSWRLDMDSARAFAQANHGDPFAVLGPHDTENGRIIRAFLPGAIKVELLRHRRQHPRAAGAWRAGRPL